MISHRMNVYKFPRDAGLPIWPYATISYPHLHEQKADLDVIQSHPLPVFHQSH